MCVSDYILVTNKWHLHLCLKKYLRFFIMTFCFLILNVNSCTCVYCNLRDGIKIRIHVPEFNILYIYLNDINDFVYMIWKTKIPHCLKPGKWEVMYMYVRDTDFASVFKMFRLDFRPVSTVWYFCFSYHINKIIYII